MSLIPSNFWLTKSLYQPENYLNISTIISTKFIIGDIINLKTRFIYRAIENRSSWDSTFNLANQIETVKEILFWKNKIRKLNKREINDYDVPLVTVYSDASSSGLGSIYKNKGKDKICHKNFSVVEKTKSSTWRELAAIRYSLESTKYTFQSKTIFWYTDNYATSVTVKKGSSETHLHNLAIYIFDTCSSNNTNLDIFWISRGRNKEADKLRK